MARLELLLAVAVVRAIAHGAHEHRAVRLRRVGTDRHVVLQRAAHVAHAAVRAAARVVRLLCLAGRDRARRLVAARGLERRQGVRRARVAVRHRDRRRLALLAAVFFGAIAQRKIAPIYISNWFYGALIIVIAMLHVVNNLAMPATLGKAYSLYPGAQDAVQWWYGHNAVGFCSRAVSSACSITSCRSRPSSRSGAIASRSSRSGRSSTATSGRAASLALQRDPGMGAIARRRHEPDPARAVVGDDDQRRDDRRERLASCAPIPR